MSSEMHPLKEAKIAKAGRNGVKLAPHGARAATLPTHGPHSWGIARSIIQGGHQSSDLGSIRFSPGSLKASPWQSGEEAHFVISS